MSVHSVTQVFGRFPMATGTAGALVCALMCAPVSALKLSDGTQKAVVMDHQFSWQLDGALKASTLTSYGFTNITVSGAGYASVPITDSLTVEKGSWLEKLDLSSFSTPVVLILPTPGLRGGASAQQVDLAVSKLRKVEEVAMQKGADLVFFMSLHLTRSRARSWPNDHDRFGDTLVVKKYNEVTHSRRAVDVLSMSMKASPYHVVTDMEHPTGLCFALYGSKLIEAMMQHDGTPVPREKIDSWVQSEMAKAVKAHHMLDVTLDSPVSPTSVKIGSSLKISIKASSELNDRSGKVDILFIGYRGTCIFQHVIDTAIDLVKGGTISRTFAVPDSTKLYIGNYAPAQYKNSKVPVQPCDSAAIQVSIYGNENSTTWDITPSFKVLNRDGSSPVSLTRYPAVSKSRGAGRGTTFGGGRIVFDVMGRVSSPVGTLGAAGAIAVQSRTVPAMLFRSRQQF